MVSGEARGEVMEGRSCGQLAEMLQSLPPQPHGLIRAQSSLTVFGRGWGRTWALGLARVSCVVCRPAPPSAPSVLPICPPLGSVACADCSTLKPFPNTNDFLARTDIFPLKV